MSAVLDVRGLHLKGEVPSPVDRPAAQPVCRTVDPALAPMGLHSLAACHNPP